MKKLIYKLALYFIKKDNAAEYGSIFDNTFIPTIEIENTIRTLDILSTNKNIQLFTKEDLKLERRYNYDSNKKV